MFLSFYINIILILIIVLLYHFPGTEMRHLPINDSQISTPQGLKDVLEDDLLRQYYFLSPDLKESGINMGKKMTRIDIDGNIIQQDNGGKRRIDFLLFSPQDNPVS